MQIEIDPQTSRVTAIALGSNEVQTTDLSLRCDTEDARKIAAESMRTVPEEVQLLANSDVFYVFGRKIDERKQQVRVIDRRGFIKVQCGDAVVATAK